MKRSIKTTTATTDAVRLHIREAVQNLHNGEPRWLELIKPLSLRAEAANALIDSLRRAMRLPFADGNRLVDLLIFRYADLQTLRRGRMWKAEAEKIAWLFELMMDMALQGNSLFPQNPADIASQARNALEQRGALTHHFSPIIALLLTDDGRTRSGLNFPRAKDLEEVIDYEHRRRSGAPEWCWKAPEKYALLESELRKQPEFESDWQVIRENFDVQKFQDADGVIRRSPTIEGNWRRPHPVDLTDEAIRFQVAFDFFCWKWFLYGMRGDEPLLQKLAVTLTPFGTQIFIPGFWSLDPARDINWAKVTRLHRARGINKQGEKLATNREGQKRLIAAIIKSDQAARRAGLKGSERYAYIKSQAGLSPDMDDAEIRQYLRKGKGSK